MCSASFLYFSSVGMYIFYIYISRNDSSGNSIEKPFVSNTCTYSGTLSQTYIHSCWHNHNMNTTLARMTHLPHLNLPRYVERCNRPHT
jgi:hypothetical protein